MDLPDHRVCQVETALTGDQEWMVLQGFLAEMDLRAKMVTRAHPDPRDHRALMVFLAIEEKWALKERKANLENKVISNYFLSIFLLPLIAKLTCDELVDIVLMCQMILNTSIIRNVW